MRQPRELLKRLERAGRAIAPGNRAWRGAVWGAVVAVTIILLVTAHGLFGQADPLRFLVGAILLLAAFTLLGGLLALIWHVLRGVPTPYAGVLGSATVLLALLALTALSVSAGIVTVGLSTVALASLVGAGVAVLTGGGRRLATAPQRVVTVAGLLIGLVGLFAGGAWLFDAGTTPVRPANAALLANAQVQPLAMPDPSQPGPYPVASIFYGSGTDRHRPEYGADVGQVTATVDGSALIEGWSRLRRAYWGFGPDSLPLNARVWYPQGEGPFPLVLIAHGQHPMEDFSDPGYAYLGELLAGRGFIVASVDENFLNLSPLVDLLIFQSLVEENDLRAWLLLEHLRVWRNWNRNPDLPFYGKVDLDHIALIGHSRGGEAVAVAAAFNQLPYYPDDATLRFDYGFNIRSLVAFAPVEGGYRPAGREVALANLNYLVLHGAHDMDVFTFQGSRQYARVGFKHEGDWFKAAVYIYGANHGQFNTRWGRKDLFEPAMRIFNLEQLISGEEQRQIARVTISAFLEDTLRGESGYRALFQDLRRGQSWLPDTIYLHQYQDAHTHLLCTYEEDLDLTSATLAGGRVVGENLTVWREQPAEAKWDTLGSQTVRLGWDTATARYVIGLPERALPLAEESVLVFSMADANLDPTPAREDDEGLPAPVDLTVAVTDAGGETAHLPLSHFSLVQPQIEAQLGKARFMSPLPASEAVMQHFEFPLREFVVANPAFNPARLVEVRFQFDRSASGVVLLDDVGFRIRE